MRDQKSKIKQHIMNELKNHKIHQDVLEREQFWHNDSAGSLRLSYLGKKVMDILGYYCSKSEITPPLTNKKILLFSKHIYCPYYIDASFTTIYLYGSEETTAVALTGSVENLVDRREEL